MSANEPFGGGFETRGVAVAGFGIAGLASLADTGVFVLGLEGTVVGGFVAVDDGGGFAGFDAGGRDADVVEEGFGEGAALAAVLVVAGDALDVVVNLSDLTGIAFRGERLTLSDKGPGSGRGTLRAGSWLG